MMMEDYEYELSLLDDAPSDEHTSRSSSFAGSILPEDKDDHLARVIALFLEAYIIRYDAYVALQASELNTSMGFTHKGNILKNKERFARVHYLAAFVAFEKKYIQQALCEAEAIEHADSIFNHYAPVDDPVGFKQYVLNYCEESLGYSVPVSQEAFTSSLLFVTPIVCNNNASRPDGLTDRTDVEFYPVITRSTASLFQPQNSQRNLQSDFEATVKMTNSSHV